MRSRLVVLLPTHRIYDAVRAMEDNHVGSILVHDGASLVGIVTDRDLSVKALGDDLNAFEFQLADVMSSPVASVSVDATVADVADLMVAQHIRRVPILEGDTVRGIITLDDLILEHGVDFFTLAGIVRAQLSEGRRLKPRGALHPGVDASELSSSAGRRCRRREAHQRTAYARLLRQTLEATQLTLTARAECALEVVLSGLVRRVTADEAADLLAQLPSWLRDYAVANIPAGPDLGVNRGSIERELDRQLAVGPQRAADVLQQTVRALETSLDPGEIRDLRSQLPDDLRALFRPEP